MRFFASATLETASATPELITSVMRSTSPVSYHWRAIPVAISGLFWWSAETSSTLNGGFSFSTKSSIAICAAVTAPAPPRSENTPAMPVSTPLFTGPRACGDLIHRAGCVREERKNRVDVDGILDQPQGDVDAGLLRAFSEARRIVEQAFAPGCRDEQRRQPG